MRHFEYFNPRTLKEAWKLKEKIPNSRFIAGGTDVMVKIRKGLPFPDAMISLRGIAALKNIKMGKTIRIGAGTTITELIEHVQLHKAIPVLIEAAKKIGATQIRNVATIGGNLSNCSPCADTAPALLVLDSRILLRSAKETREIPIQDFFCGPGVSCLNANELLMELRIDKPSPKAKAVYMKKGRVQMDLALASVAVLLEMDGKVCTKARIAAGSVAPVPLRLVEAEKVLENAEITEEKIQEAQILAMKSVSPIDDVRSSAEYRRQIVGAYVKRALQTLLDGGQR